MTRLALLLLGLQVACVALAAEGPTEDVRTYDQNPRHLWNRLHQTLFIRVGLDGTTYGHDRLDPLFWGRTRHLLEEDSHQKALEVLDEFLRKHGERLIRDPLRRAFLQHDLWALFDWSALPYGSQYARERTELQLRLAQIIRRLALSSEDLASLSDNYARAVAANAPASLPHGLFQREGEWVILTGAETAPRHVQNFGGRSTFHVLLRLPGRRAATLAYLERLRSFERPWIYVESPPEWGYPIEMNPAMPQFPPGTEWALVRRMRVIDPSGAIQSTPVIESIQLRRYVVVPAAGRFASTDEQMNAQQVFEFMASRVRGGDLREVRAGERDFLQFQVHDGDPFELSAESLAWYREHRVSDPFRDRMQHDVLRHCFTCHAAPGVQSVQSLGRITHDRRLSAPKFTEADPDQVLREPVHWTSYQYGLLRGLWER
jgi:hypothetical protein